LGAAEAAGGRGPGDRMRTALADALQTWPVNAAVAVTTATVAVATAGPLQRVRPWASVTKLVTALAVEEGTVDLDQPAGPPGSTLRHLLAHASGLGPDGDAVLAAPGTRRIYSNAGFDLIGTVVEAEAGIPFGEYVRTGVLDPLGMHATSWAGSPAAGASGPLNDLLLLARELLAPTLISAGTLRLATTTAFDGLDGVLPGFGAQRPNDWGLGFELRGDKHPHWTGATNSPATFGHFGQSGSFLWVDPPTGLACVELASGPYGPWANTAWPALSDAVLTAAAPEDVGRDADEDEA
jgi:CubicO group peptidase (beta-lactamase class C family)